MLRTKLSLLLLTVLACIAASGCGGGGAGGAGGAGSSPGKVRLTYWVTPEVRNVKGMEEETAEYGDYEKRQAAEYMAAHPEVEVQVQSLSSEELTRKVTTSIAAGSPPDILKDFLGRTAGYAHQGLLEDFQPVVPSEELEDYEPFFRDLYTINGQLHGLPCYAWAIHVVANRAVWKAAGKEALLPEDGSWNYDEFLTALRAVAKPGKLWPWWAQFASEQGDYTNYGFFWGRGAYVYAPGNYERVALNTPGGVESLTMLVNMAQEGLIPPGAATMPASELENMIGRGEVAAWGDSLYAFHRIEVAKKEQRLKVPVELMVLQYPREEGQKSPLPVGPTGFVVFKQADARKREAALEFARWLNRPEFQKEMCANVRQFPTRKSTGNPLEGDPNYARVQRWLEEHGRVDLGLTSPAYYRVRVAAVPHLQAAILKQKSPADALKDFEAEANGILQSQ